MNNMNHINPLPYARNIYFVYRPVDKFPNNYNQQQIEQELLSVYNEEIMDVVSFWTNEAVGQINFVPEGDLIRRGILWAGTLSASGGPAKRERTICDGKLLTSLPWFTPGFDIDPVPAGRPVVSGSIEEGAAVAFEAQLATTIDVFCKVFNLNSKKDGADIRDALYYQVKGALDQNKVRGTNNNSETSNNPNDAERERGIEQIRRWANRGRKYTLGLGVSAAASDIPISTINAVYRKTTHRLRDGDDDLTVITEEPNPTIRTEIALLLALSDIRELARELHRAHLDIRRDDAVLASKGAIPLKIVDSIRHPLAAVNKIVEEPVRRMDRLTSIAEIAYPKGDYDRSQALLRLSVDVALRYEVDILQLFPTHGIWRSMPQAARAVSANRRRGELPEKNKLSGVCAYWGLRALVKNDPLVVEDRKPLRDLIGPLPSALQDFALSEFPAPLGMEATERFRN